MSKQTHSPVGIVTGAGSGIGRSICQGLASAGYRVVLVGRRHEALRETGESLGNEGSDWIPIGGDVSIGEDRARIVDETIREFGRIDAMVNNAGLGTCKVLGDLRIGEIHDLFAVNAIGPIDLVRLALPELIKSKGCVVNVASIAIVDPFVGLGVYGCAKAAVDGLSRCLHNEYGEQGIRAYTVAPGAVETAMLRSIISEEMLPSDQTLSPEMVAGTIVACITGEASEPSGSTIVLNSP